MNKLSKYEGKNETIDKYVKQNIVHFIRNPLKRIYYILKLIFQVTVKICIYIL